MVATVELLRQGRTDDIWKKYCGFLDLDMQAFMEIQQRLLLEQLELLGNSDLGTRLLGDPPPTTVDAFRATVPLTTYQDYVADFGRQREDILPVRPRWWLRTSGRSGEYGGYKWAPYSEAMAKKLGEAVMGLFVLAAAKGRGEFPFREGDRLLYTMAPFPYMSGGVARAVLEEFPLTFLPPLADAEAMEYQERIAEGLRLALREGLDHINAIAIVLVRIAEQFSQGSGSSGMKSLLLDPRAMGRILRGMVRARMGGRKTLMPKDLWDVKGIATGGTDTVLFRDQVREMWGQEPVEAYGCTEAGVFCLQPWKGKGLAFLPDISFLEFLPMDEYFAQKSDPAYLPRTILLDEVEAGGVYEVVVTNYHGGAFIRYRVGDFIRIVSLRDEELGTSLPKMEFHSKATDIIDLASFTRLTERTIWLAIEGAGFDYADWTARKEYFKGKPILCIYLEPAGDALDANEAKQGIHQVLKILDPPYADIEDMMGIDPLRVTLLPVGAFKHYYETRQKEGADLAHLKPPHMNVSDESLALLNDAGSNG